MMSYKLFLKLVNHSFQEFLIDRFTAFMTFVFGFLFFALEILAGFVFFEQTDNILGWTRTDYLLLVSTASTISFLYQTFFVVSHEYLAEAIIEGELDYAFLRPVSSLYYFALYRLDIPSLMNLVMCMACQIYFMQFYNVSFVQGVLFVVATLLAAYFVFILNQLAVSLSFWVEKASSVQGIPEYLVEMSSRPFVIYPNVIRFMFTWLVPVLIGINLPILIVKNDTYFAYLIALCMGCLLGTYAIVKVWAKGIEQYISAN